MSGAENMTIGDGCSADCTVDCGRCKGNPFDLVRNVLGDLIDDLGDELKYEISKTPTVQRRVRRAIGVLGPEYQSYLDDWWLT